MSRSPTEEPTVTREPGPGTMDQECVKHPAFAQIGASRVSGRTSLYASDFNHNAFMTVTIRRSELRRSLSNDWHYGRGELIEIAMSEAQWATFVSSPNVGSGVPCTIQHIQGEQIPRLPEPGPRSKQFGEEMREKAASALESLDALAAEVAALGLSKAKADKIAERIRSAKGALSSSIPFIAEQFSEHMERTVEGAKAEVHGYMTGALMRSGLDALTSGPPPLQLDAPKDPT